MRLRKRSSYLKRLFFGILIVLVIVSSAPFIVKSYITGVLEDEGYEVKLSRLGFNIFIGDVRLSGLSLTSPDGSRLNIVDTQANINMISLFSGEFALQSLDIDGAVVDVSVNADQFDIGGFDVAKFNARLGDKLALRLNRLRIQNSEICGYSKQQCLHVDSLSVSNANLRLNQDGWYFSHSSPLSVEKVFLRNLSDDVAMIFLGDLRIAKANYSAPLLEIIEFDLNNFQFINKQPIESGVSIAQTQMGRLTMSTIHYQWRERSVLDLGDVVAISLRQAYSKQVGDVRSAQAGLNNWISNVLSRIISGDESLHFSMNHLTIQGGVLSWQDNLVTPPAKETVSNLQLKLGPIDSQKPNTPAALAVTSTLGEKGLAKFEGDVFPMGVNVFVKGSASIQDWKLSNISAYTPYLFSQRVKQGTIDLAIDVLLDNQQFAADSRWQVSNFEMDKKGSALSNAMEILKDRNESVRFALPISGALASQTTSLEYIFGHQMEEKLKSMTNNQMGSGSGQTAGDLIVGSSTRPNKMAFRSLLYMANSLEPAEIDTNKLEEVATLLKSKPQLALYFCPVSSGGEWAEIFNHGEKPAPGLVLHDAERTTLIDLARSRGQTLQRMLINFGALSSQIKLCEPSIDLGQLDQSFVTITM